MKPCLLLPASVLGLACALLWPRCTASAQSFEVQSLTLTNGLKVLMHKDDSIPNAVTYIFYRIGSRNERPGTTGISHFFEHMMFNGAKIYGPKQFDNVMEAAGGANNAYTSYDTTVYMNWFPVSALELIFDLEADRIENLAFVPSVVESERGVVSSERRMSVEANNNNLLDEQLWAAAFTAHPYHWPVIGWMSDIEQWKMEDLQNHFRMGYSPANATMVVAGAIDYGRVTQLAKRYLEPIPAHAPPPPVTTKEPEQQGERRVQVSKFAQLPILMVGYHVPEARHTDYYPLQVLRSILFSGQSSRMYRLLVDGKSLATQVEASMNTAFDPTLFTIAVQPREGVDLSRLEKALFDELERVTLEGVTDPELQKAKNNALANLYRDLKTLDGKAHALGNAEVFFGDYRTLFTRGDAFEKVTKEDVQRAAKTYFQAKNRTVATLLPEKQQEPKAKKL